MTRRRPTQTAALKIAREALQAIVSNQVTIDYDAAAKALEDSADALPCDVKGLRRLWREYVETDSFKRNFRENKWRVADVTVDGFFNWLSKRNAK